MAALWGTMIVLMNQSERRSIQRIDRLEERMDRGFEQMRAEMNQGFAQLRAEMSQGFAQLRAEMSQGFERQDGQTRSLEQGQAYMSGQFSELKDYFVHRPSQQDNLDTGD